MAKESPDAGARTPSKRRPIGLALAGGAAGGAIYEIGALRALDEAIPDLEMNDLDIYVGVSAGAFLASCLANGLSTAQMCRAIIKPEPGEHPFVPEMFFQPAAGEMGRRLLRVPGLLAEALSGYFTGRERRLRDALTLLGRSLPVAIFQNDPIREYIRRIFSIKGRTDDFRQLPRALRVIATDLESAQSTRFGEPGNDQVSISRAVQASTALPGLYPPVEIDGRLYVDGILRKTMHASAALEWGAELVFCINPIVPVDARKGIQQNEVPPGLIVDRGLPAVLSQTMRTLINSRMHLGLKAYESRYPDAEVVLLEPARDDYESFFSNIFTFRSRRAVCERAYQTTRRNLLSRRETLAPKLAEHGLHLDLDFLRDPNQRLWATVLPGEEEASSPGEEEERARPSATPAQPADTATSAEVLENLDRVLARARKLAGART